ncbi:GntR family transcriptional regulator [Paenibacillus alginolyticus]|uniref:GntR family transcriptional regulator n=1 Tax=Paenibacillus alginolyticus TaxID=59839 RepID=A0ABT4G941_9BACL|nr:GntR family transcriptional regulator [Paenibacillus alginolyticus]MCY9666053.1 GntR family transcriptional regulator [Paenibacillus alginolyticus]MCY9692689.1 GntR family transcriptional regulator [Paenibacillus alginolyticus]MEC0146346.1 GntR family transcriptional regulator [Paenibacillus alginolyticus]
MSTDSRPIYERIFETLREEIIQRKYNVGDRVPSEKELADEYNVSRITSKKALEMLAEERLIVRKPGRGSFVMEGGGIPAEGPSTGERTKHTLIGLVITDFGNTFGTEMIYGMERASAENDSFLVLRRSFGVPENEVKAIRSFLELGVDGIIVFPAQGEFYNDELLKLVIQQFPLVLVDRHLKGVAAASISTDNIAAARTGADYLLDLGHKQICLLTPPPMDTTAIEDRIEGFVRAHAERGVMVDRSLWLDEITSTLPNSFHSPNIDKDIDMIKEHLRSNPQITALFAIEYNIALLAKAAVEQMGLQIPADISIICFDSPPTTLGSGYRFTHLIQAEDEIGKLAVENVLKLKQGEKVANKISLEAKLIIGESTGPSK